MAINYKAMRNTMAVFVATFLLMTIADHATTLKGLRLGYRELNPRTDFTSMHTLIFPEALFMLLACVSIGAGFVFGREVLANRAVPYPEFRSAFMSGAMICVAFLILVPLVVAAGRVFVVINNLGVIVLGWGFMELPQRVIADSFDLSPTVVDVATNSIFLWALIEPSIRLVWRLSSRGGS